ncbi:MAG TPA: phosphate acetyltransferase [Candidatus Sulfotelmatobacter sp.]|jgi:phosphate acetyltransferase|nr:phosphate acetyltransferase [Candidatus Sulfotelmatobacter sp.]
MTVLPSPEALGGVGNATRRSFFLAPAAQDVGLTSISLGLLRALQRDGIKAGFVKPIAQPEAKDGIHDLSTHFARTLCHVEAPAPLAFHEAEDQIRAGQLPALMEDVVSLVEAVRAHHDVVVVEGLIPDADRQMAARLNAEMARSLTADLIPVLSGSRGDARELAEAIDLAQRQYDEESGHPFAGYLINKVASAADGVRLREDLSRINGHVPVLGAVPFEAGLNAPRLLDVIDSLGLKVEHAGSIARARVQEVVVAAGAVESVIKRLRPGVLVVTPGDRSDVILATALAGMRGVPLAGLLLTCGRHMAESVESLALVRNSGLPILFCDQDTFVTASALSNLNHHVSADDGERMDRLVEFIAERLDTAPLRQKIGRPAELRMPPPAFRHRLVQDAQKAGKRIVLPEGDEPRTLQAAAICAEKGIASCVLLGDPVKIGQQADALGIVLPKGVEVLDPEVIRASYVQPMVEMRKAKGLTAGQADEQLQDTVVLGTMMLALGDADGLVSGAVHTTANTVRPALQLIKTAPGNSLVSSVFFMLMPDQVLVYGDCAVNPDPTAEELAEIAIQSADSAKAFGIEPRVAMISYSTGSSGSGDDVEKVRAATKLAREKRPDLLIDGPMQYDAASVESVGRQKAPDSPVAGRANVFVFPDLNTGNTTYKAVQRSAHVVSVGPMLQGLRKPVNDLSRGALVDDIVYTIALTAIQAG